MDETKSEESSTRAGRREEWRQIVAAQQTSGQTASVFCRERGIPVWKFGYWHKALSSDRGEANRSDGFVEMRVTEPCVSASQVWIEAGRWRVCVTPGFDPTTLRQAVEALSAS